MVSLKGRKYFFQKQRIMLSSDDAHNLVTARKQLIEQHAIDVIAFIITEP